MSSEPSELRWVPLESNPEVMTKYSLQMGCSKGQWVDIYGFDDELLAMVPQPVVAVMLLFPISAQYDENSKNQDNAVKESGQVVDSKLFYMKQYVHNACGTVGLIHALSNNSEVLELKSDSILQDFITKTANMSPAERGEEFMKVGSIAAAHEQVAEEGQTAAPNRDENLITHFVAFVNKDGHLYELDGRREFPINHGTTSAETLLKDAAAVCKKRCEENPNEYRFTMMALTTGDA